MDHFLTREAFDPILIQGKRSEILPMDLDVRVGDLIRFREIDPEAAILTGRFLVARIVWAAPVFRGAVVLVTFDVTEQGIEAPNLSGPASVAA